MGNKMWSEKILRHFKEWGGGNPKLHPNAEILKIQQDDQLLSTTMHKNVVKDISIMLMLSEMDGF